MVDRDHGIGWEINLSDEAKKWVEQRRRRYMPSYSGMYADGYRVVAQLSPKSGRLVTAGKRVGYIQELEANDIIQNLQERDRIEGRRSKYDFIQGCVEPLRKDGTVNKKSDIRAYRYGISILERKMDKREIAADAVLEQILGSLKEPVGVVANAPGQRRASYPQVIYN